MLYSCFLKRTIDFIVAFFVLAVIWPILLLLIIFLHFTNKGAGVFSPRIALEKMPGYSKP